MISLLYTTFVAQILIQSAIASSECGFDHSNRSVIGTIGTGSIPDNVVITSRASSATYFGKVTIPIAVYTDKYFDGRFKELDSDWTPATKSKYQGMIVNIFKTASIAYKYDSNMKSVADISFKIVHVATSTIDTVSDSVDRGEGDKIGNRFEEEQFTDKKQLKKGWRIAVLLLGVNAWMEARGGRKKKPTSTTGLARRGVFCDTLRMPNQQAAWVEAKSPQAGLVVAHEIGHV